MVSRDQTHLYFSKFPVFFVSLLRFFGVSSFRLQSITNMALHEGSDADQTTITDSTSKNSTIQNATTEKDPTLNLRSPFYLHPNKFFGSILLSLPLDDNNDHNWRNSMRRTLTSKNKLDLITITLSK